MQKHLDISRRRLRTFVGDIRQKLYTHRAPIKLSVFTAPDRIPYDQAVRGRYRPAKIGDMFGPLWSTHWFKLEISIPKDWRGREVHLLWDSSGEACVWQDGQPQQGLTGTGTGNGLNPGKPIRPEYRIVKSARGGERITLYIETACNSLFGLDGFPDRRPLQQAELAVFDRAAWDLLWDYVIVTEVANELPTDSPRAGQALAAGNEMVNLCNVDDRKTWPAARAVAAKFLAARNGDGQHNLSAVGHAHIDTAWLWPLAETRRKCVRTFSSAVRYMEEYPDYKFACSQAQQYAWMKESHPRLYKTIKARVAQGKFIPAGGTWIEPDCNLPSGESLVRQFLVGQRFFRKEFGITCREFWNPDVFGYNGQLPQIMRGAGIEYFLTQKLSWNQFNRPIYSTFDWEGIDGSRVLTHFPPADTYNAMTNVREVLFNVKNFKEHERARESYLLFGFGDGGGGPTTEMLERLQRMKDVDGLPRIEQRSPQEFFRRCAADIKNPIVWVGELYFETHRGTYTTQALNKLNNRRSEFLLHDIEFLAAVAHAQSEGNYPATELDRLWKLVLLNQFHDIIPGSSINEVYIDSAAHYNDILSSGAKLRAKVAGGLIGSQSGSGKRLLAINTLGFPRTELVEVSGKLSIATAPAMGYSIAAPSAGAFPVSITESRTGVTMENQYVRAVIRRDGRLVSLFDKRADREAIAPGEVGNRFALHDDMPTDCDAWDVEVHHLEKRRDIAPAKSLRVIERHPLRATIELEFDISAVSTIKQTISLAAISPRLDFTNEVEWRERHRFLKVEFPFNVRADQATYEIQFGHLSRPTHYNTTWDLARFEVSAHRWADLGEPGFGVALLNDCKYGYATRGHVMSLSLLRSPTYPDTEADQGHHKFRYALLPHAGTFREAGVIEEGYRFNSPLLVSGSNLPLHEKSFFQVSSPHVILDTVKKAEESDALIVRLYEAHGAHGRVRLTSPLPVKSASRCNLLEEQDQRLKWAKGGVEVAVTPFQIVTLKLALAR